MQALKRYSEEIIGRDEILSSKIGVFCELKSVWDRSSMFSELDDLATVDEKGTPIYHSLLLILCTVIAPLQLPQELLSTSTMI